MRLMLSEDDKTYLTNKSEDVRVSKATRNRAKALLLLTETDDIIKIGIKCDLTQSVIKSLVSDYKQHGSEYAIGAGKFQSMIKLTVKDKVFLRDIACGDNSTSKKVAAALLLRDGGVSIKSISRQLKVSISTIFKWCRLYNVSGLSHLDIPENAGCEEQEIANDIKIEVVNDIIAESKYCAIPIVYLADAERKELYVKLLHTVEYSIMTVELLYNYACTKLEAPRSFSMVEMLSVLTYAFSYGFKVHVVDVWFNDIRKVFITRFPVFRNNKIFKVVNLYHTGMPLKEIAATCGLSLVAVVDNLYTFHVKGIGCVFDDTLLQCPTITRHDFVPVL